MKISVLDSPKDLNLSSFKFREIPDNPVKYSTKKDAYIYNGIEFSTEDEAYEYKQEMECEEPELD